LRKIVRTFFVKDSNINNFVLVSIFYVNYIINIMEKKHGERGGHSTPMARDVA